MTEYRRWGFWGTTIWSVLLLALFVALQVAFLFFYITVTSAPGSDINYSEEMTGLRYNGDVLAFATFFTTIVCVPIILGVIKLKRGSRLADYLPLTAPPVRTLALWSAAVVLYVIASDVTSLLTDNPVVPEFMEEAYASAGHKALLWAAIVLAAPLFEEIFFRGFVMAGLAQSKVGAVGAVVIASLAWATIHVQYDLYGVATIFLFGLMLGAARIKTGSLATPLLLHAFANAIAILEVVLLPSGV